MLSSPEFPSQCGIKIHFDLCQRQIFVAFAVWWVLISLSCMCAFPKALPLLWMCSYDWLCLSLGQIQKKINKWSVTYLLCLSGLRVLASSQFGFSFTFTHTWSCLKVADCFACQLLVQDDKSSAENGRIVSTAMLHQWATFSLSAYLCCSIRCRADFIVFAFFLSESLDLLHHQRFDIPFIPKEILLLISPSELAIVRNVARLLYGHTFIIYASVL